MRKNLKHALVAFYLGEAGRAPDAGAVQRGDHRPVYLKQHMYSPCADWVNRKLKSGQPERYL
jgi:hypothetical protein